MPLLEQAVQQGASMRFMADHALQIAWLSKGYVLTGQLADATVLASRPRELSGVHREQGHEAWALHLLGEIASHRHPPEVEQAQGHYQQALTLAAELDMRPLVAHCHRGLGTLYRIFETIQIPVDSFHATSGGHKMVMTHEIQGSSPSHPPEATL